MRVTEKTSIEDLVEKKPATVRYLLEKGVKCIICGAPVWDTVGELLKRHGIKGKDRKMIISDLNEL